MSLAACWFNQFCITLQEGEIMSNVKRRHLLTGLGAVGVTGMIGTAINAQSSDAQVNTSEIISSPPQAVAQGGSALPQGKFTNKVVLITGATSGIGMVTAQSFAKEGAKVFFCGRRENKGAEVQASIRQTGGEATYMKADVRQEQDVKAFVDACVAKYGRLDIAFNNAGIGQPPTAIKELTAEQWLDQINTNLTGMFYSMKYEIPYLEQQNNSVIINTSSIFGQRGAANLSGYSSGKFGAEGLTKVAALELAPKIRVVGIAPGAIAPTDLGRWNPQHPLPDEAIQEFAGPLHALGRFGSPQEVANAVLWLASDEASFVTGDSIRVDGYFLRG
jgi:NAD(P)-dependent dehydrogenase (short-subunit alcohol dehydrogenase family)